MTKSMNNEVSGLFTVKAGPPSPSRASAGVGGILMGTIKLSNLIAQCAPFSKGNI
jgi:hypothetical protein